MAREGKSLPTVANVDPDLLYGVLLFGASKFLKGRKTKQTLASVAKPLLFFGVAGAVRTGTYTSTDQASGLFVPGVGATTPPYGWSEVVSDDMVEEDGEL